MPDPSLPFARPLALALLGLACIAGTARAESFLQAHVIGMVRNVQATTLLVRVVNEVDGDTSLFPAPGDCPRNTVHSIDGTNGPCWSLALQEEEQPVPNVRSRVLGNYVDSTYVLLGYPTPRHGEDLPALLLEIGRNGFHNRNQKDRLQYTALLPYALRPKQPLIAVHEDMDQRLNRNYKALLDALPRQASAERGAVIGAQRQWLHHAVASCGAKPRAADDEDYARCRLPLVAQGLKALAARQAELARPGGR